LDQSDRSYKSSGSAPSRRRRISKELQQDFFLKHMGSDGNGKISVSELEEAVNRTRVIMQIGFCNSCVREERAKATSDAKTKRQLPKEELLLCPPSKQWKN
jgi:hypothetical protein